jgi:hypothetical protein
LDDWIYCALYIHTVRDYRQYSAVAILHTFQFTVTHALKFSVFTSRILATDVSQSHCNFKSHVKSSLHNLLPFLSFLLNYLRLPSPGLDPVLSTTVLSSCYFDSAVVYSLALSLSLSLMLRPTVSRPVCLGAKHPRSLLHVWQLRSCSCGAPSLTRGRVCPLYMLLALASAVFLGSESLGTWDHILLSQIWDFPFRSLLRLAGSRWRYSTPPSHRCPSRLLTVPTYNSSARTPPKTPSSIVKNACLLVRYLAMDILLLGSLSLGMCLPTRCLAMGVHVTIFFDRNQRNLNHSAHPILCYQAETAGFTAHHSSTWAVNPQKPQIPFQWDVPSLPLTRTARLILRYSGLPT